MFKRKNSQVPGRIILPLLFIGTNQINGQRAHKINQSLISKKLRNSNFQILWCNHWLSRSSISISMAMIGRLVQQVASDWLIRNLKFKMLGSDWLGILLNKCMLSLCSQIVYHIGLSYKILYIHHCTYICSLVIPLYHYSRLL